MAKYGISQGQSHPVPPTQSNRTASWTAKPPIPAHRYPASQHINNPMDYSYGAPNAVLCQTPDGVTGYMIWHGDPNAFPTSAHIHYEIGPVYPKSCPSKSNVGWGPLPPPTPDSGVISTQGFVPHHDFSYPAARYQSRPGSQDSITSVPGRDVPRVMPMPSAGGIDLLNFGQWQGNAVPAPGPGQVATATQTGECQFIGQRPVVETTARAMDLLTQPMTPQDPSYILSGKQSKWNLEEWSSGETTVFNGGVNFLDLCDETVADQSKSPNVFENNGGVWSSREATMSLDPSLLMLSSSIASPDRYQKRAAKPGPPIKRFLAMNNNVQSRKKRHTMDGIAESQIPGCASGAIGSPVTSETISNPENNAAGWVVKVAQGTAKLKRNTIKVDSPNPFPSSPNWEKEMNSLFDFDGASLCWIDEPFWKNEDPAQTGQHGCPGHPMKIFRGTKKAPFSLNPWVDDELHIPLCGI